VEGVAARIGAAQAVSSMLQPDETNAIIAWVRSKSCEYESEIKPMLDQRCMGCHDGSVNPHLPNLNGYDNVRKVTEQDTGANVFTLVRVSHIHLFGVTFIFFILGTIFSHAYVRPVWFVQVITALRRLFVDIASWYFTKLYHPFAIVVMLAGAIGAVSPSCGWSACTSSGSPRRPRPSPSARVATCLRSIEAASVRRTSVR
jgi:hypothetical protein